MTRNQRPAPNRPNVPRYEVKWVNGIWTIFDRWNFTNCEPDLYTRKNAERVLRGEVSRR